MENSKHWALFKFALGLISTVMGFAFVLEAEVGPSIYGGVLLLLAGHEISSSVDSLAKD